MVHQSTRRSSTGHRARRQQAIRKSAARGRLAHVRPLQAVAGALLLASVALAGQIVRAETELADHRPGLELLDGAAASDPYHEVGSGPAGAVRQGGDLADATEPPAARSGTRATTDPVRPIGWYRLAAAEYGVSVQLLEALHQVESNASPDACIANLEGSGATGPFQFKPATFAEVGVDANHDGIKDICGFADSLFSAARYLRTIGADEEPASMTSRRALKRYGTDVERVVSLARAYQERDGMLALASAAATRE